MNRDQIRQQLLKQPTKIWDIVIIGGGASGLGAALEAASRGYRTLLLEQADFAKGTSSRSTKLVHGGVRYLAQGNLKLVKEALRERGILANNAPHLVRRQSFLIPSYAWHEAPFYGTGLKLYDWLAGSLGLGKSRLVSRQKTQALQPNLKAKRLKGGVLYYDGQFDDARLAINLAQSTAEQGGFLMNYVKVTALLKSSQGNVEGVVARDLEHSEQYTIQAKVVLNATGVFVDDILRLDRPEAAAIVRPSQGVHIVLDRKFLKSDTALMIPKTSDGRVLFLVPWQGKVVVGTTDTSIDTASLEPQALEEEVDFILQTAGKYLQEPPKRSDIRSIFAGLRPLAAPTAGEKQSTKEISRNHQIIQSASGLLSIVGGKWTTYRQMGEELIDRAAQLAQLPARPSITANLPLRGYTVYQDPEDRLKMYGSDRHHIRQLMQTQPVLSAPLHPRLPYTQAEVLWAIQQEMARRVEDVLARRTRALFLDAQASIEAAPVVAKILAEILGYSAAWQAQEVEAFKQLAQSYCASSREETERI